MQYVYFLVPPMALTVAALTGIVEFHEKITSLKKDFYILSELFYENVLPVMNYMEQVTYYAYSDRTGKISTHQRTFTEL
jgi:hypothetical protein